MTYAHPLSFERTITLGRVVLVAEYDQDPDLSWLEADEWNEETATETEGWGRRRIADHGVGWLSLGLGVRVLDTEGNTLGESTVWGIEDDSDPDYFAEVFTDCLAEAVASEIPEASHLPLSVFADRVDPRVAGGACHPGSAIVPLVVARLRSEGE